MPLPTHQSLSVETHQRDGILCLPGKCGRQAGEHRKIRHSKDWQGKRGFVMLKIVWASKQIHIKTKIRIFNSNIESALLYRCETWRTTKTIRFRHSSTSAAASVVEWLRHRSHTTRPLTSSLRRFESCSDRCDCVRKFVSLLAEGRWCIV
jgi:hypothetical protein